MALFRPKMALEKEATISFNQTFPKSAYQKILNFKTKEGLDSEQAAIRFIVTQFLKKNGY